MLTDIEIAQAVKPLPIREIADYIGCSASAISYRMRKEGLHGLPRTRWDADTIQMVIRLNHDGVLQSQIAKGLNVKCESLKTIFQRLRRKGLVTGTFKERNLTFHETATEP